MRNFIIGTDDQKYEVVAMHNVHGHETDIADEAEAITVKWGAESFEVLPALGKVWTLQ